MGTPHAPPSRRDKPLAVSRERSATYYRRHDTGDSDNNLNGRCNGGNFDTLGGDLLLFGTVPYRRQEKPLGTACYRRLIVAEASFKKSPVMKLVAKPYQDYVQEYNEKNKALILGNQAKKKVIANKLADLEKKADADTKEMSDLAMELSSITNADFRRIIVDDITPESLVRQLAINGTLPMMSDEAGSLGNFNGRYSANGVPNLDLLLKSWNGETFISDRITRESVILYKPYVSICLACQPYIWDSMIGNMAFRGSGFLARLVYCFPKDLRGTRKYNTEPILDELSERYHKLIYALLNYKFQRFELHQADEKLLFLDEKAKDEYVFLHDQFVEKQLVTDMAFCADWGGKFHGLVLRICGILHCIKTVLNGEKPDEVKVSHDTMCNAIEIGHYFRLQAIYAYGLGDTDNQTLQAEHIVTKIRSKNITQIRQNDLYKLCRCKLFKNAQEFAEVIAVLEEYGYLKSETIPGANNNPKGCTMLYINPLMFRQ